MEKKTDSLEKKTYIAPDIEVVEIEVEQNIFAGSGEGSLQDTDMSPVEWN